MEDQVTTSNDAPHAEWPELLAPWLNVAPLIGLKISLPPLLTVSDPAKLRIEVSPPPKASSSEETSTLSREVLELLEPCWTKRSHVVEFVPVTLRESHPIRHLTLKDVYGDHAERIVELLEVIGGPIERITVESCSGWQMSALLSAMEVFCPNLKRLELKEYNVETMNRLLEGDGDMFKLETLCLFDTDVEYYGIWAT